ncbi:MAG: hypothetical protein GY757_18255 [bacterium]|nr:hypothetical protein [bacterium]
MRKFKRTPKTLFVHKETIANLNGFDMLTVNGGQSTICLVVGPATEPVPTHRDAVCTLGNAD